jgi:hypothetical protein
MTPGFVFLNKQIEKQSDQFCGKQLSVYGTVIVCFAFRFGRSNEHFCLR